jgi:hypothetical protein
VRPGAAAASFESANTVYARAVALVTQKGSSGKSTLATGLAVAAMQDGERVFMVETDRPCRIGVWRRSNPEPHINSVTSGPARKSLAASRKRRLSPSPRCSKGL